MLVPFSVYWTYPALNVLKLYRGPITVFGRIRNGVEGNDSVMGKWSWEDGHGKMEM